MTLLIAFLIVLATPMLLFAQASQPSSLEVGDAAQTIFTLIGGMKGVTAMGLAMLAVQVLMVVLRTRLADFTGLWRWFVYSGLALVATVLGAKLAGQDWLTALLSSTTMTALGTWLHQLPAQAKKAHDEKAADGPPQGS